MWMLIVGRLGLRVRRLCLSWFRLAFLLEPSNRGMMEKRVLVEYF